MNNVNKVNGKYPGWEDKKKKVDTEISVQIKWVMPSPSYRTPDFPIHTMTPPPQWGKNAALKEYLLESRSELSLFHSSIASHTLLTQSLRSQSGWCALPFDRGSKTGNQTFLWCTSVNHRSDVITLYLTLHFLPNYSQGGGKSPTSSPWRQYELLENEGLGHFIPSAPPLADFVVSLDYIRPDAKWAKV